jgi:hypothetical protein
MEFLAYAGKVTAWVLLGCGIGVSMLLLGALTANIKDADSPACPLLFWRKKKDE